uniref:Uncharacterized protein n=1 Tax=Cacopsylla melanoneura TaxID=428564 RepID=A0A8D8Z3R6_9HEMI
MPVDSIIERASAKLDIQSLNEWVAIIKMSRQNPFPYEVKVLEYTDFKNWAEHVIFPKNLKKYDSGANIEIRNFFSVTMQSKSNVLTFRMNNATDRNEQITLNIPPQSPTVKNLYTIRLPISIAKYKDLKNLCDKNVIRKGLACEFLNLPHKGSVDDSLIETDEEDVVEEPKEF